MSELVWVRWSVNETWPIYFSEGGRILEGVMRTGRNWISWKLIGRSFKILFSAKVPHCLQIPREYHLHRPVHDARYTIREITITARQSKR